MHFLCLFCRHAAESLLQPLDQKSASDVEDCLKQALNSVENSEFELTNAQFRFILSQYKEATWVHALKIIICQSQNPAVIPHSVRVDLVDWAYHFVKDGGEDWNELFQETGTTLSKVGHASFQLLGEFCSMIRDCSRTSGADVISQHVGAELLIRGKANKLKVKAATLLFTQMVNESSRLFGQSAVQVGTVSFGIRSQDEVTQWNLIHFLPPEKKNIQDLRTFYSYIDKKFVGIVEDLFEYHDFVDIAEAINNKYGMIPAPWKTKLNKMKSEGKQGLQWFNYATIRTPTPGASKNTKSKSNSPIRARIQTKNDILVDSFIEGEVNYYRQLGGLAKFYVKRVLTACEKVGTAEADALLLNKFEVDIMFGLRFQKILDVTHMFLTNLEVINLTRKPVNKKTSREQILAKVVKGMAENEIVAGYARFSSTYPQVAEIVKVKHKKKLYLKQNSIRKAYADFFDIWNQERNNIKTLENMRLEQVMELPVRRIHAYKEIIKQLLSNSEPSSDKYKDLYDAYVAVKGAADELTRVSEKHALRLVP